MRQAACPASRAGKPRERAPMNPIQLVFQAYEEGRPALLLTGRSLYDLIADGGGKIRPLMEVLRRECRERYGMLLVTYSLAGGLDWDASRLEDPDRRRIQETLRAHHLLDVPQDQNEVAGVIRGISSLSRAPAQNMQWADGKALRFCFLLEFSEHLMPGSMANGTQAEAQLVAIELVHITAQSLALRLSGNLILFHAREGLLDGLVCGALHRIRMSQPDIEEKKSFLAGATALYTNARFADDLSSDVVTHLTTNTPNRGLESLLRASHRNGRAITARELVAQKNQDVEELSEQTLTVLNTARVDGVQLYGVNIQKPQEILARYAGALRRGDRSMPANVLLVGPPGGGKTDLAIFTARHAGAAAYQQHSPKGGIVGETERKARIQQEVLEEWVPNISFVDEITENLPLERSDFDGDSGASRAVTASLLTALSNENRRGKSLLIATTNCPWRMGAAMRSRFTIIPVLHPIESDFPGIVLAMATRVAPDVKLDPSDPKFLDAARIFYEKGANPRQIHGALSNAVLNQGQLTPELVLFAAQDLRTGVDRISAIYTDLWAIKATTSRSFLPWQANPSAYPYPAHLAGIIDPASGEVNEDELDKHIEQYRSCANV